MHNTLPSAGRLAYLRQKKRTKNAILLARVGILVALFASWEIAARLRLVDAFIVSSPSRIVQSLANLAASGDLWLHVGTSVGETVLGFVLGTALGILIAIALWWSSFLCKVLDPYLVVLNSLPKTALGPIFIVWMGAGAGAIVAMTLAISLVVTVLDMLNGFASTDKQKIQLMRTLGASKLQILCKLVLPANLATMINALKVNVGLSWVGVIMGEFLVSRAGLGYLIVYGSQVFQMDLVMTTVLLLAAAAALMYQAILLLERAIKKPPRTNNA